MKPRALQNVMRAAVFLAVLVGLALAPGDPSPVEAEANLSVLILSPLVRVYEGDTLTLPYTVVDLNAPGGLTLAPLTPGTAAATASLGQVSAEPDGLYGTLTYTAEKHGEEQIVLTIGNALGSGTGTIELTIYPRPNYDLNFIAVSEASDEAGGAFRGIFSGQGQFANVDDAPISGEGKADYWFSLWVTNPSFVCSMDPPVQGATNFTITGVSGGALVPGALDPMILDLNFPGDISLNGSTISCSGLGGIAANFPWPASSGPVSGLPFNQMFFNGEGGVWEISAPSTWGFVTVTRIEE